MGVKVSFPHFDEVSGRNSLSLPLSLSLSLDTHDTNGKSFHTLAQIVVRLMCGTYRCTLGCSPSQWEGPGVPFPFYPRCQASASFSKLAFINDTGTCKLNGPRWISYRFSWPKNMLFFPGQCTKTKKTTNNSQRHQWMGRLRNTAFLCLVKPVNPYSNIAMENARKWK